MQFENENRFLFLRTLFANTFCIKAAEADQFVAHFAVCHTSRFAAAVRAVENTNALFDVVYYRCKAVEQFHQRRAFFNFDAICDAKSAQCETNDVYLMMCQIFDVHNFFVVVIRLYEFCIGHITSPLFRAYAHIITRLRVL